MDFQLNDEQLQLKKSVREFAEREIAPNVMKWDEAGEFPLATIKELGKLGLMGMIFPVGVRRRGHGLRGVRHSRSKSFRAWMARSASSSPRIPRCARTTFFSPATKRRRKKYIPKLATGEFIGAWGLTEPSSGSDAGSARMTAVRKGNNWVLNGTKTFCTNGHYADVLVVDRGD